jgi:hypothetical protein
MGAIISTRESAMEGIKKEGINKECIKKEFIKRAG